MVYAKLLAPVVMGSYKDLDPGLYLYPRVIALWIHLHYLMFSRVQNKSAIPRSLDWRSTILTQLWGATNKLSGDHYAHQIKTKMNIYDYV